MQTPQRLAVMSMDDIVFAGRNQSYGAYVLRQSYTRYLLRALLGASAFFVLVFISPLVLARFGDTKPRDRWTEVGPTHLDPPPALEKVVEIPPVVIPPPPVAPSVRYLPPVIVPDKDIKNEEPVPDTDALKTANPGTENLKGDINTEVIGEVKEDPKAKEVEAPKEPTVFSVVEVMPQFPGGMKEFARFLQKNLRYPRAAEKANIKGRVVVSFVVSATGEISEVHPISSVGFGCDEEAVRVVSKMPAWNPGIQGGRKVAVRYNVPITFSINE